MKYLYLALLVLGLGMGARYIRQISGEISAGKIAADSTLTSSDIATPPSPASAATSHSTVDGILDPGVQARVDAVLAARNQVATATNTTETPDFDNENQPNTTGRPASPSLAFPDPIRQNSSVHPQMITPGNFEYLGAFRPPHVRDMLSQFGHGAWAITYRPDGDRNGPDDGHPGSLYLVGFQRRPACGGNHYPQTAPVTRDIDDLTVSGVLQPFGDITAGLQKEITAESSEPFMIGGMQVVDSRLHWTLFKYYNVAGHDFPSHGVSSLNVNAAAFDGPWHLGPMDSGIPQWHSYKHAGYIAAIPDTEANQWFGGRNLMSGLQISTGLKYSSQGPALYAYRLPDTFVRPGGSLDAVPLLWYSQQRPLAGHHPSDRWTGAAWLTLGGKQTIVVAGRKAHGEVYYGNPRPTDCYPDKGYHGSSYEVQMLFYTPAELIAAANGRGTATEIDPWYRWDNGTPGGGIDRFMFKQCGRDIGGLTYDTDNNLLYMVEVDAGMTNLDEWEPTPVIHAFRVVE